MTEGKDTFDLLRKFHVINGKNKRDDIINEEGPNSLIRFAFCAFHPFLREVQLKLAPCMCQPYVHVITTWRLGLQVPFIAPTDLFTDMAAILN